MRLGSRFRYIGQKLVFFASNVYILVKISILDGVQAVQAKKIAGRFQQCTGASRVAPKQTRAPLAVREEGAYSE